MNSSMGELPREQRLRDRLAVRLAAEIVSGRLRPDDVFPSADDIVQQYGVSRTVAREALQTLTMVGFVRSQQGKRTVVMPPEGWNVLSSVVQEALRGEGLLAPVLSDLYEFRALIEPSAAAWMAERASEEERAALAGIVARMRAGLDRGDSDRVVMALDGEFHNLISRSTGNRILAGVQRDIAEALHALFAVSRLGEAELAEVVRQHQVIADAIVLRDANGARDAMTEHLAWAEQVDLGNREAVLASTELGDWRGRR
jgi:GntR family transcriptional regulator, galactonate operon transcriptional repressor